MWNNRGFTISSNNKTNKYEISVTGSRELMSDIWTLNVSVIKLTSETIPTIAFQLNFNGSMPEAELYASTIVNPNRRTLKYIEDIIKLNMLLDRKIRRLSILK